MFDIAISTINRDKNQYLFDTLNSFYSSLNSFTTINLVVGNPDITYLSDYKDNSFLNIIPMSEEEWLLVKDKNKCDKFNLNFYRCLTQQPNKDVLGRLYLEDDIVFKKDWDKELKDLIIRIKSTVPEFALSLYSAYDLSKQPTDIVQFEKGFYGTQGVFFTSGIIQDFADKIMNEGVLVYKHMADLLLQEYCNEKNIPLFTVKDSLIQHIGIESSIHSNTFHKSVTFKC